MPDDPRWDGHRTTAYRRLGAARRTTAYRRLGAARRTTDVPPHASGC